MDSLNVQLRQHDHQVNYAVSQKNEFKNSSYLFEVNKEFLVSMINF